MAIPAIPGLCNDVVHLIFRKLTLRQLLAIELVSKQWQEIVNVELRGIKRLKLRNRIFCNHNKYFKQICVNPDHQFHKSEIFYVKGAFAASRVIKRLPGLIALHLDGYNVQEAIANCKHLVHLVLPSVIFAKENEVVIPVQPVWLSPDLERIGDDQLDLSKITCLSSAFSNIEAARCPKLQFITQPPTSPLELAVMLKNGLRGVVHHNYYEEYPESGNLIADNGHDLEVLRINRTYPSNQVQSIFRNFKSLRVFQIMGHNAKDIPESNKLDTLHWEPWQVGGDDVPHFTLKGNFEMLKFGHGLKTLILDFVFETGEDVLEEVHHFFPNLIEFHSMWGHHCAVNPWTHSHPNLEVLTLYEYRTNGIEPLRVLINSLPKLRRFKCDRYFCATIDDQNEVKNLISELPSDFPAIKFEMTKVEVRRPEEDPDLFFFQ